MPKKEEEGDAGAASALPRNTAIEICGGGVLEFLSVEDAVLAAAVSKDWRQYSRAEFQRRAKRWDGLTEDEVFDLKEAFSMFDSDGDGTIALVELKNVMRALGQNPSEKELMQMFDYAGGNCDHEINFEEFLILMSNEKLKRKDRNGPLKDLRDAMAHTNIDDNGSISRNELKKLMKDLGQTISDGELDAIMDELDTEGNGGIDFEDVLSIMQS